MHKIAILIDPIETLNRNTDSTLGIVSHLQKSNKIFYINPDSLSLRNSDVTAKIQELKINLNKTKFYQLKNKKIVNLKQMKCIFIRKDPPVDEKYIQMTHILDHLEKQGVLIINSSQSLRDLNEKLLGNTFSPFQLPTLITPDVQQIKKFIDIHKKVVIKPLNMMRGENIQMLTYRDQDYKRKILLTKNHDESCGILVQKYLNVSKYGDKRIIIYNGIVNKQVIVRYPMKGDFRANLIHGGNYSIKEIDKNFIAHLENIAEYLLSKRIYLAGVDMIDKYITEINITSPTGIMHLNNKDNKLCKNISEQFIKVINEYYE